MSSSGAEPQVLMSMTKPDALQHIEITVLRQLGDNISAQTRHLEAMSSKVDDVRERVIRIEARGYDEQVKGLTKRVSELEEELEERVAALEARNQRVSGVTAFGAWIVQAAPWLVAATAAVFALMGRK